jgi:hypothetical protein
MSSVKQIISLAVSYENVCGSLLKSAYIRKLPDGKYRVFSEDGCNLGTFNAKNQAEKHLQQIEFFKFKDKLNADDQVIDLTDLDDLSYSAIMRKLRQKASPEYVKAFLYLFKEHFDLAVKHSLNIPEDIALKHTLIEFRDTLNLKLNKQSGVSDLGSPVLVGQYLADIIRFILNRLKPSSRPKAINTLRNKFYALNVNELAHKKLPASSALGQSITFVKHVLFNHNPVYIREVLKNVVKYL